MTVASTTTTITPLYASSSSFYSRVRSERSLRLLFVDPPATRRRGSGRRQGLSNTDGREAAPMGTDDTVIARTIGRGTSKAFGRAVSVRIYRKHERTPQMYTGIVSHRTPNAFGIESADLVSPCGEIHRKQTHFILRDNFLLTQDFKV